MPETSKAALTLLEEFRKERDELNLVIQALEWVSFRLRQKANLLTLRPLA
jgi:hypothetical protein